MNQKAQSDEEEMLSEDLTPPSDLVARMKISWPKFFEILDGIGVKKVSVDEIKEEVQRLDPNKNEDEHGFQVAVVLMSAAFVTGPDTETLAAFTGYRASFIAEISRRMHQAGKWRDGFVRTDHWFNGEKWTVGFWIDTLVAEGFLLARQRNDGKWEYRTQEQEWQQ
jgi:hypothetical protein